MFFCPHPFIINNFYRTVPENSYIRILNASPNSPAVDIYLDNKLMVQNLAYTEFSKYMVVSPGDLNIKIYPAGQKIDPVLNITVNIPSGFTFNMAIIGLFPNISIYDIPEPSTPNKFNRACIRFINLSPNSPAIDLTLPDGTKIFNNIKYKDYSIYACIPPGTYTLQIRLAGTNNILLTITNVQLMANKYYSLYLVGLANNSPPLQAFVAEELGP